jgi:hypothetical protein
MSQSLPRSGDDFTLIELDEDHAKAVSFNMLFMVWRHRTLNLAYRRGMQLVRDLSTRFPEGIGVCQVVEVDAVPPDSDTRRSFVDFLKLQPLRHFSVIHDGVGFKAASVRAVIAGVHALARPKCRHAVHSNVPDAAAWHAAAQLELNRRESAQLIEGIVRGLRERHRSQYP